MKETLIKNVGKNVKPRKPVLVVGLPGIGLVGKLAVEHMVKELKAERIAELYSPHFPHQVIMRKKGTLRMLRNRFYYWKNPKKGESDIIFLVGDVQAITSEAQHEVCGKILDYFIKMRGKRIYTLGGYGVGKMVESPKVFGSATSKELVREMSKKGILFGKANGSIIGAAGLLLGLGHLRGMEGLCIMGETHGGYVDAKCAQSVLKVLSSVVGIKVDLAKLEQRAKESERFMKKMEKEAGKQKELQGMPESGLSYIR